MRAIKAWISFILLITLSSVSAQINHLVVFGDSYSDNGNTFSASKNTYPGYPYNLGRFSNGPTWSTYLAQMLGLDPAEPKQFQNFAYGQAEIIRPITLTTHAVNKPKKTWRFTIPNLGREIRDYKKNGTVKPEDSLYVVFIGTNDFLNHDYTKPKLTQRFLDNTERELNKGVERLKAMKAKKIVLFTLRRLDDSPLAHELAEKSKANGLENYTERLQNAISAFNNRLARTYKKDKTVQLYDIWDFDKRVKARLSYPWYRGKYRLTDRFNACYQNHGNYIEPQETPCFDPWAHFFFDRIHLTTYANMLLARDVFSKLAAAEEPEEKEQSTKKS